MSSFFEKLLIWGLIGFVVFLLTSYVAIQILLQTNVKYTIGVTERKINRSAGSSIHFTINVNNKVYSGDETTLKVKHHNGRYLVKYIPWFPYGNKMLRHYEVTDTTIVPPPDGWDEIPERFKK